MPRGRLQRFGVLSWKLLAGLLLVAGIGLGAWTLVPDRSAASRLTTEPAAAPDRVRTKAVYKPARYLDTSSQSLIRYCIQGWAPEASLEEIAESWRGIGYRCAELIDQGRSPLVGKALPEFPLDQLMKTSFLNWEGEAAKAYAVLERARRRIEDDDALAGEWLYTVIYLQGVTAFRRGENENCIMCRGESSCILPISPAAVHTNPEGSRLAITHYTEYLEQFPDDLAVRWLLNLAHMTLGEHPQKVDPKFLISLDHFRHDEFDIGRFRDVGAVVGVNRFNHAGGGIMDDFDNDGLLDIVTTAIDPASPMSFYRNTADGKFADCTDQATLKGQLGGLYCVQADFNNDGFLDIYIPRGAWVGLPMRPSLLENQGDGTFADVTEKTKLLVPVNSNSAAWADYDNDGRVDLFVCCEPQVSRLFHNRGDGTFEEVAREAGIDEPEHPMCKGVAWVDFDNDDYPDLFLDYLTGTSRLYRNNRNGTFSDVTEAMQIDGPMIGFSCWAWDYDNDGWLDVFATCYERTLADVIKGLLGEPHSQHSNKLFRNVGGERFEDVTQDAGLDLVFATMGSNFGDFDNDGYLDFYLGTGDPTLEMLRPNRMFKNVAGRRFSETTAGTGTGLLQKGHSVACGDWDRDGNVDIFIEMGGFANGDRYHNVLFQNPGHDNRWLALKLVGVKTNRPAIGARVKIVTAGDSPLTIHRLVSSGSSFGANPLEQTIGLGAAERVALLEIHWPASGTTQVFRDLNVNQSIEIAEFENEFHTLRHEPILLPK